ncbi:MAG: tetratricopeptide repeat protein [Alphaproteobacteria bacterium]
MTSKNLLRSTMILSVSVMLAACQTTGSTAKSPNTSAKNTQEAAIDTALERAAASSASKGEQGQSLGFLEKLYKRNSADPQSAINYAAALREAEYYNQAALVLAPFANDKKSPAAAKTEYAAVQLALGNDKQAEKYAQKAVLQDNTDFRAYHYLGIALDGQGMHKEAERAFRKALDMWQGDPIPVMNNLALNLASQEYLDEAVEILEKAQAIAPDRVEVERNLRIVRTLLQSARHAPKPGVKPAPPAAAPVETVKKTPVKN